MATNPTAGTGTAQRPVEDIEAIMGKFSAWSRSHSAGSRKRSPVSEVSYEQALQATRFRRVAPEPVAQSTVDAAKKLTSDLPEAPRKQARKKATTSEPTYSRKDCMPRANVAEKPAGHTSSRNRKRPVQTPVTAAELPDLSPTFQQVVEDQVTRGRDDLEVSGDLPASENVCLRAPSVSLTVRLSGDECALVKARAAEARISVSAYVRQCTLDVDLLRAHVERVLAEFRAASAISNTLALPAVKERRHRSSSWLSRRPGVWLRWGLVVIRSLRGTAHYEGTA